MRVAKHMSAPLKGFIKQSQILQAEGEAQAIKLVNEAAQQYFTGNAILLRKLEALEKSLQNNAKIVVPFDAQLVNVIGELAGVYPFKGDKQSTK